MYEKDTLYEYKLNGTVRNAANLSETGRKFFYGIKNNSFDYKLGTKLDFTESATANPYCIYGFDRNEVYGTWINSTSSQMKFKIGKVKGDLLFTMNYSTYEAPQNIILYANDEKILDIVSDSGPATAVIPKECLKDNGVLDIKFDIPAAHPIEKEGNRCLALFMKDVTISKNE